MTIMRNSACLVALCLACSFDACATGADDEQRLNLPFPVVADEMAGTHRGLPKRLQDKRTGAWYVLIPGGTFRIGADGLKDSKEIEVEIGPFYMAELPVSYSQVASYLKAEMHTAEKEMAELSEEQRALGWMDMVILLKLKWPDDLDWGPQLGDRLIQTVTSMDARLRERGASIRDSDREAVEEFKRAFEGSIQSMEAKGNKTYRGAHIGHAMTYADAFELELPTEAQWEVAARAVKAGTASVDRLFDGHLEWCSDYYAYDYFQRTRDFKNPSGPRRGKLSPQQIADEVPDSGLTIMTKLAARNLGVLRGKDVSTRYYGSRRSGIWGDAPLERSFRLVINLTKEKNGRPPIHHP